MKNFYIILFVFASISLCHATDIHMKDGSVLRNIKILDTTGNAVTFGNSLISRTVQKNFIDYIVYKAYNPSLPSEIAPDQYVVENNPDQIDPSIRKEYPNLKFLPLSILAFGLSWDYFEQGSEIGNQIDAINKLFPGTDVGSLQAQQQRKTIIACTCVAVGIANLFISIQEVDIKVNPSGISMAYHF